MLLTFQLTSWSSDYHSFYEVSKRAENIDSRDCRVLLVAWQLIRSWIPTETQNAVKFVDEKTITQYAAPDQVWKAMGGTATDTA